MPLAPGTRLGPYEIIAAIGAGGMGEVYSARDTRLNRDVAIKILPDAFAVDTDRVARFQREAHILASLNHTNIAHIYGLEDVAGHTGLVLELVTGPTLADVIAKGPIPLDEALATARQIADALEAAHEQGIVHRDLKPANIKMTPGGVVKVLDFGLAKALDSNDTSPATNLSMPPTITSPVVATRPGMILGTAAYMSPEQAKGRVVDKRADIWAFGCVLYEMMTGKRPFDGDDVTDTLAFVITKEPDWNALPAGVSPTLRLFIQRCLKKNPRERLRDVGDLRLALEGAFDATSTSAPAQKNIGKQLAVASVVVVVLLVVAYQALMRRSSEFAGSRGVRRFAITAAPGVLLKAGQNRDFAISPDGSRIAYFVRPTATLRQLHIRALDALEGKPLHEATRWYEPFFSPDGKWIAFTDETDYVLKKISVGGGPVVPIARTGKESLGAAWGADQVIVFSTTRSGLSRVAAGGGAPVVLTTPNRARGELAHAWPVFVPGRHAVLFTIVLAEAQQIASLDLDSGEQRVIVQAGTAPHLLGDYLVYGNDGALRAIRFDARRLDVVGEPVDLVKGIVTKDNGSMDVSVAEDGTLAYLPGSEASRDVYWVDRLGAREPVGLPPNGYFYARLSPDGSRIALDMRGRHHGIVIWNIARRTATPLPSAAPVDGQPIWLPDSATIVFTSQRKGAGDLYMQAIDRSGGAAEIASSPNELRACAVLKDGAHVIFSEFLQPGYHLKTVAIAGGRTEMLPATHKSERNAALSPDGNLIAYQSDDSGHAEIYIRRFPDGDGGVLQVSSGGGIEPAWAGHELFYVSPDYKLMSVAVAGAAGKIDFTIPKLVLDASRYSFGTLGRAYDVTPDGKRFLLIEAERDPDAASVVIVVNWLQELQRIMSNK